MSDHLPETALAHELALIGERLAALASSGGDAEQLARELVAIGAHLQALAEADAGVAARLGGLLGTSGEP